MAYERVNWENLPSTNTPVNADNLNKMDAGIANIDTKLNAKQDKLTAGTGIEITDENIINNIQGNHSTEGTAIGTWIDGKKLYRKVINVTIPSTNTDGQISEKAIDISNNINKVIKIYGYIENTYSTIFLPVWITDSGNKIKTYIDANKRLYISNEIKDYNNLRATVIVEYTKNTD